jgi:hypothetical protein
MFPDGEHWLSVAHFTGPVNLSFGLEAGHADLDHDDERTGRYVRGLLRGFVFACKFFFDPDWQMEQAAYLRRGAHLPKQSSQRSPAQP